MLNNISFSSMLVLLSAGTTGYEILNKLTLLEQETDND
jgi:hypothetical protein